MTTTVVGTITNLITTLQEAADTTNTTPEVNTNPVGIAAVEATKETEVEEGTIVGDAVVVTEAIAATTSPGLTTGKRGFPTI